MTTRSLITLQDLDNKYGRKPYHMVVIYANWCGACHHMIQTLGDKFDQYDLISFYESEEIADGVAPHYPYVMVYENSSQRDSNVGELYKLLDIQPNY